VIPADPPLVAQAARAWRFRCGVEREAEARFARLAGWLARAGLPGPLVELCRRSSADEGRHARLCAELTERHGGEVPAPPVEPPAVLAPAGLPPRAVLLYEAVAACCVTETGSVGVLTALLGAVRGGSLRRALRTLAADEVRHSRLGWAILAAERERGTGALLGEHVPAMLAASIEPDLFRPGVPGPELDAGEDPALLELGVLPRSLRREVFVRTTTEVVLPGLEEGGVDISPARAWLRERLVAPGPGKSE
jgi:hypothetical protein